MILFNGDLPYPPSVNHYWVAGRKKLPNGRTIPTRYKSKAACAFIGAVKLIVGKRLTSLNRCGIEILVYPPDKRCRDIDNIVKGIFDSLITSGLMQDDEQIDDMRVIRCNTIKGGKVRVKLYEL